MTADDALLALERHATSKITDFEDFATLSTLGFRGEAVPSIASISRFSLLTNASEDPQKATLLFVEGGRLIKQTPAVRARGTTIEVKDLFFNVPVRKKFQRSPAYDAGEIYKMLSLIALANPHVKITLIRDGETILSCPSLSKESSFAHALKERAARTLSHEWTGKLLPLEAEGADCTFTGWIGPPSETRPNRQGQTLFINRRPVQSPLLSHAVKEGYGTLIAPNRFPVFLLNVQISPECVDVNVHPQKKEVRLAEGEELAHALRESVSRALKPAKPHVFAPSEVSFRLSEPALQFKEFSVPSLPIEEPKQPEFRQLEETVARYQVTATLPGFILAAKIGTTQLFAVHQRRAHARILFDGWSRSEKTARQKNAFPTAIDLSDTEAAAVEKYADHIEGFGFTLRLTGPRQALLEEVPAAFAKTAPEPAVRNILAALEEFGPSILDAEKEKELVRLSFQAAVSSSALLDFHEARVLLERLVNTSFPQHAPNGEKIWLELTHDELLKLF
ncbi:MAG: hypothetical protein KDK48_02970 [Chlamydiia bacterium]|nr:hypothetical protein [Chlamydiia bacterium]